MLRVAALPVAAQVVQVEAVRNLSHQKLVA
jgi:hypothetical protein